MLEQTHGEGADRGCEAVGYQCHDHHGDEVPNITMNQLVAAVRPTGGIGVVGVLSPEDLGAPDDLAKEGKLAFDFCRFWFKGQSIKKPATEEAHAFCERKLELGMMLPPTSKFDNVLKPSRRYSLTHRTPTPSWERSTAC